MSWQDDDVFDPSDLSSIIRLAAIGDSYSAGIGAGGRLGFRSENGGQSGNISKFSSIEVRQKTDSCWLVAVMIILIPISSTMTPD